jgi:hypothetical protein
VKKRTKTKRTFITRKRNFSWENDDDWEFALTVDWVTTLELFRSSQHLKTSFLFPSSSQFLCIDFLQFSTFWISSPTFYWFSNFSNFFGNSTS